MAPQMLVSALLCLFVCIVSTQKIITAGDVPASAQTYDFSSKYRCRLLAHQSAILDCNGRQILVIDSGFGSFSINVNGSKTTVLDLNPYTVAFDLSGDFVTPGLEPLWQIKKPAGPSAPPVTNHGGVWHDGKCTIWYQGGHYYNSTEWTSSRYHIDKSQIPPWNLWSMNVTNYQSGWKNVTSNTKGHELVNRTFAGGAASVPQAKKSWYMGGVLDGTTSATSPNDTIETTDQMVVFDHLSGEVTVQKYFDGQSTQGQYEGDLIPLPIGPNSGALLSLMSEERPTFTPWVDSDGPDSSLEVGDPVTLDSIPLYDIETQTWFEQKTSWYMDEIPTPRTRFCSALFQDPTTGTWDLWVHGGQQLTNQNSGVADMYVLSMPSFIWTKVETTIPDTNLIRSHTCHAVGGQFIIVGGYPAGIQVPTNATCDAEYVKVLAIGEDGPAWTGSFATKSTYKQPDSIRNIINKRTTPIAGFANSKLQNDFTWKSSSKKVSTGAAAGGAIGGVAIMIAVLIVVLRIRKKRAAAAKRHSEPREPRSEPPMVVDKEYMLTQPQKASATVTEVSPIERRDTNATFELD